jgi:peptidoglycan/LPS O-acetylase OafA/YrhL
VLFFVLILAISIAVAALSFRMIEVPSNELGRRLGRSIEALRYSFYGKKITP